MYQRETEGDRKRQRETERHRERQRGRQRESERDRERQRETERDRERQRERKRKRKRELKILPEKQRISIEKRLDSLHNNNMPRQIVKRHHISFRLTDGLLYRDSTTVT